MVKTRHAVQPAIVPVAWRAHRPRAEVEVFRLSELAPRIPAGRFERLQFHLLALFLRGRCTHDLDFTSHACAPGTLLRIEPGQVHRWGLKPDVEGFVLVFQPSFLFPDRPRGGALWTGRFFQDVAWPPLLTLRGADLSAVRGAFARLEQMARELDDSPLCTELLRSLVSAALLDVARRSRLEAPPAILTAERDRARRFCADVERSFHVTRAVRDYAERLGCAPRTLDRTCHLALGVSAKAYVDARVVLEARRLLAHTPLTVAEIGEAVGFSEPTNFVKFFRHRTGESPGAFRATRVAGGSAESG